MIAAVLVCIALALLPVVPAFAQAPPPPPSVATFSPTGTVKQVRQVTARFSVPMVPLGDPRPATEVFEVECPEPGVARWIDSRDWVYDFARDLPAGVRCVFRLRATLTALDGRTVGGTREFTFSTGGPAIKRAWPPGGASWIDEEQAFVLALDGAATDASILRHASFTVGDRPERIGVRIVTGDARGAIFRTPGARAMRDVSSDLVVIQARQRFPHGTPVKLVWGAGVAASSGVATAQDQVLEFKVRDAFSVEFSCDREQRDHPCLPLTPMRLEFTAPLTRAQAERLAVLGPAGRRWRAETKDERQSIVRGVTFKGPFPENATFQVEIPHDLRDDAGRTLANADRFPLTVKTGAFPPLAKFPSRFGIVESADPVLPVSVRRLEPELRVAIARVDERERSALGAFADRMKASVLRIPPEYSGDIVPWLRRVATAKREGSVFGANDLGRTAHVLPRPHGSEAFEVMGLPLGKPGLYIVELESARLGAALLGEKKTMYVPTAALVTNLSVHFKWGNASSLVWVTALDTGRPVESARVTVQDCGGTVLWRGRTGADGIARIDGLLARRAEPRRCGEWDQTQDWPQTRGLSGLSTGLLVVAQTPDDLSFVHSSWQEGIEPWRFGLRQPFPEDGAIMHTIFDRPLYRAGETVHMKHVLRTQTVDGFGLTPNPARPASLFIEHVGSDEKITLPLTWDGTGVAESTWTIPRDAKLGRYALSTGRRAGADEEGGGEAPGAGEFRVEEFRIPFMRATLRPPTEPQVGAVEIPIDVGVQYLAGGSARNLPVLLRAQVQPRAMTGFEDFDGFVFANGSVAEGTRRRELASDSDEADESAEESAEAPRRAAVTPVVHQRESLTLDAAGTGRAVIRNLPRSDRPRDLLAELEFRDPAGEVQTVATRIPLWPATRLVGVKPQSTMVFGRDVSAQVAVVDVTGRPVAGAPVRVDAFERRLYSHRKRLVGGFYAYEHAQETKRIGEVCRGETGAGGVFVCETTASVEGQLILQASTTDPGGRTSTANHEIWVVPESSWWWFDVRDSDRIDVIPERRHWQPGETARFQVRMPFREATALVTVEREGIIDAFVTNLSGRAPVVEVPVRGAYGPNVFVSALVVRGRVGDVQPTALVDLGRPAFKLGIAEIRVGWRAHELTVKVTAPRTVYRVRERVPVTIAVRTADGAAPPRGSEVALAAVDEGLLELLPNTSWNILESMMRKRGYGVNTMTAQLHVVGKRHFGLKALPTGGGGGRRTTRELFDTLLLWKARVPLDADGHATIEVPLNDSLTSFRIVAVATGGVDAFGTGALSVRATQDLMILPGLPPLVREGDRFAAETTVRNTTDVAHTVSVTAKVEGLATPLEPRTIALAPGDARVVTWDVTVPVGPSALRWQIEAEGGGLADRVAATQTVVPAVPVRAYQATITQWDERAGTIEQTVERPAGAVPGRGGVEVSLRPTLASGMDALRDAMRRYPYTCLEQRVSVAVALRDRATWDVVARALASHLDGQGLLKYFATMNEGSEVLTAYVLAIAHEAGWPIDEASRGRMVAGLDSFIRGRVTRGSPVAAPDLTLRKLAAIEALSRYGAAKADMVSTIRVEPNLWPTSAVLDWWSVLRRLDVPDRARRRDEAERIIRARLTLGGTTLSFSTERSDNLWWLMLSPDTNALRLILTIVDADAWKSDVPRLVRAAIARQRRGVWDLTTSNAWGVLALEKFSAAFERGPVTGTTAATLVGQRVALDWAASARGGSLSLPWPAGREDLRVQHQGTGRPWITLQSRAAIPLATPLEHGYRIVKTVVPIEQRQAGRWSRGDLVRVRLEIEAQADMAWVVVNDPVPAGASHVGRGLMRESTIAAQGQQQRGVSWVAYEERGFESYRAYYAWVPKGKLVTEYTLRLNQSGRFVLPTTRVEALYAPETFAERPNAVVEVAE